MSNRLRELSDEVRALETRLREAGGAKRIEKLHQQGKLSAREVSTESPGPRMKPRKNPVPQLKCMIAITAMKRSRSASEPALVTAAKISRTAYSRGPR